MNIINFGMFSNDFFDSFENLGNEIDSDSKKELDSLKEGEIKKLESITDNGKITKIISKGRNGSYSIVKTSSYTKTLNIKDQIKELESDLILAKKEERYEDCAKIEKELRKLN